MCDVISGMAGVSVATNVALAGAGAALGYLGRLFWSSYSESRLCCGWVFPKDVLLFSISLKNNDVVDIIYCNTVILSWLADSESGYKQNKMQSCGWNPGLSTYSLRTH